MTIIKKLFFAIFLIFAVVVIAILFFIFSLPENIDCFIADSTTLVDEKTISDKTYRLYSIVRGWHDKTESLELFVGNVDFDSCGKPSIDSIDYMSIFTLVLSQVRKSNGLNM